MSSRKESGEGKPQPSQGLLPFVPAPEEETSGSPQREKKKEQGNLREGLGHPEGGNPDY